MRDNKNFIFKNLSMCASVNVYESEKKGIKREINKKKRVWKMM